MDLIVPCAGLSTRYPGDKPKYLWPTGARGVPMIDHTIGPWRHLAEAVRVAVLRRHVEEHQAGQVVAQIWPDVDLLILEGPTSGAAETVALLMERCHGAALVRDPDAGFLPQSPPYPERHYIFMCPVAEYPHLYNAAAKSYVCVNDQGLAVGIVEKRMVSDFFACGGFYFGCADDYLESYGHMRSEREPYVSHVIEEMMRRGHVFHPLEATVYQDYGTYESWLAEEARRCG